MSSLVYYLKKNAKTIPIATRRELIDHARNAKSHLVSQAIDSHMQTNVARVLKDCTRVNSAKKTLPGLIDRLDVINESVTSEEQTDNTLEEGEPNVG